MKGAPITERGCVHRRSTIVDGATGVYACDDCGDTWSPKRIGEGDSSGPRADVVEIRRETARALHDLVLEVDIEVATDAEAERFKDALKDLRRALRREPLEVLP